jgi:hypothetical protein
VDRPARPQRRRPARPLAAQVPELTAAQHALSRARRRHGWAATFDAAAAATGICLDLRARAVH